MTKIPKETRERMAEQAIGKVVAKFTYEPDGDYYVLEFEDGTEMCLRPMVDLV